MIVQKLKIAAGFALLAAASIGAASTWTGSGPQAEPARGFAIRGRVLSTGREPVPGAELSSPLLKIRDGRAFTERDGSFSMVASEGPAGEFPILVAAPGYAARMFSIELASRPPATAPIGPAPPPRTTYLLGRSGEVGPDLELDRGVRVDGRVVRDGKPVPGAVVGFWRDATGFEGMLPPEEIKADDRGRFRFPHAPANTAGWVYLPTGSPGRAGAARPLEIRTPAIGEAIDLGDLAIQAGRTVSGRVILADGSPLPDGSEVLASAEHASGIVRVKLDREGGFALSGLPEGRVEVCITCPGGGLYAPAGFRASALNKCLDPLNPWRLVGRVDGDVRGLTFLFEPGEAVPASPAAKGDLVAFEEARDGPIEGVPTPRGE